MFLSMPAILRSAYGQPNSDVLTRHKLTVEEIEKAAIQGSTELLAAQNLIGPQIQSSNTELQFSD